ncbi:UvrD-helicase domain-containing protein [Candidatus Dojkabacteria bacterium]|nr:UvrD-helicase domain-containing protein [Candidatus Dojkabacteria bacterium]
MILDDLNSPQKQAVQETEGPLLILAGAGSGKTRVITYRIAHILEKKLARPNEILAVTFTNKAAGEMKERVRELTASSKQKLAYVPPFIGTFHSICVKILRRDGQNIGVNPNFTIYDEDDQIAAVKQAMKNLGLNTKEFNPKSVLTYISGAKNELITPDLYRDYAKGYFQSAVAAIYPAYQTILRDNSALDFDDLIGKTVDLFQNTTDVLEKYQRLFKYVLVDEYQDTNHAQYIFVNSIAKTHHNICVVGDDDQAIYSWRGATIKNILSFEQDYPETRVIKLEQNYRSTKKILEAAFDVIRHNESRKAKKLWTERESGFPIQVYTAMDEKDEARFVTEIIKESLQDNLNDVAILYRTNAQSRVVEEAMLVCGIPYRIFKGQSFYQRKEIKDVLAYLRVIYNSSDNVSLKRIINTPPRKIGAVTINKIEREAKEQGLSMCEYLIGGGSQRKKVSTNSEAVKNFIRVLGKLIKASDELNITQLIEFVLDETGYTEWLDDGTEENQARIENLKELLTVAEKFKELEPQTSLAEFLNEVSLIEEQQIKADMEQDHNRVTLMTLHSAKGLEFKDVFIIGMEEGLFPHSRSYIDPSEMEEERRLAYVGITRAKDRLFLTHAESRRYFGSVQNNLVSRFVGDIPEELVEYASWDGEEQEDLSDPDDQNDQSGINEYSARLDHKEQLDLSVGDRVEHAEFEKGTVVETDGDLVKVDFGPLVGVKQLSLQYAKLKRIEREEDF